MQSGKEQAKEEGGGEWGKFFNGRVDTVTNVILKKLVHCLTNELVCGVED
jgi:hypothetical protein